MSNPLTLYMSLIDEGSGDAASHKVVPISYSVSPDRSEVILGSPERTEAATFILNELPPFLQERSGLHLGHLYTPQIYLDNQGYYLEATPRKNHYRLVSSGSNLFGFSILQPQLKWQERAEISKIHFENFDPGNATHYFLSTLLSETERPLRSRDQVVYSPADCQGDENYCGPSNPDSDEARGFGLRGKNIVYTYKVSPDQKTVTVAATPTSLITADIETNDTVRERYFFTDPSDQFQVGVDYPIYIWVSGQKRYLSRPHRLSENGPTTYELTSHPEQDTARFSPMREVNWREMTLTPNDFINLAFNNIPELALWRDDSYQGHPAVVSSTEQERSQNPTAVVPVFNLSQIAPIPASSLSSTPVFSLPQTAPAIVTVPPFWTQWWFWLLIGVLLLLIIVLIVLLTRPRTPQLTAVYRTDPATYVKKV